MKILSFILSFLLVTTGAALGAQNVANTSQKGSLLIWPLINITSGVETLIEISNDANRKVHVNCNYVNEYKGRRDFHFELSKKQTASWAVRSRDWDQVLPAVFPSNQDFLPPANFPDLSVDRGALVCFAVNADETNQIAWNHLTGTATIVNPGAAQSFRYNAWSFVARGAGGLPEANNVEQGTPGRLDLTGGAAGTYDACPAYNIANFMPNGATLDGVSTVSNVLSVVSCNQDLTQDWEPADLTKLKFTVWNSYEHAYTGAYVCVDSVNSVVLGNAGDQDFVGRANFDYATLQTDNARFQVSGVASTQCPASSATGLLGVLASGLNVQGVGTTTHGAGSTPGFVLWDNQDVIVPARPKR